MSTEVCFNHSTSMFSMVLIDKFLMHSMAMVRFYGMRLLFVYVFALECLGCLLGDKQRFGLGSLMIVLFALFSRTY